MDRFLEAISELTSGVLKAAFLSSASLLLAGELRLAALKKVSEGSSNLSSFTEKMTGTRLLESRGGKYAISKKPH